MLYLFYLTYFVILISSQSWGVYCNHINSMKKCVGSDQLDLQGFQILNTGFYLSAHVLMNLLKELRKRD